MSCERKHTKNQFTDEEWEALKCKKCGHDLIIENDNDDSECVLLHVDDNVCCSECGEYHDPKRLKGTASHKICPTCKGKGYV